MVSRYFPIEEYEGRWERVHAEMKRRGLDVAVVWGRSAGGYERCADVLYLTNYFSTNSGQASDTPLTNASGFSAVILQEGETPVLRADEPPHEELIAADRADWHYDPIRGLADDLNRRKVSGRVALVGSGFLPMKYWGQLTQYTPSIEWEPADDLVQAVRRYKSLRELDCYREGGEIVTRALDRLLECMVSGKTEAAAAADAAAEVVGAGGSYHPGFPRWLLPIAEKSNTIGIPKAIPTRSCHDRLGSALDRVCLAMRNSAP